MLYLYVLQNQWVFTALLTGLALMLVMCLTYQAMWRPRHLEAKAEKVPITGLRSFLSWLLSFMPWVLLLTIFGSVIFTVATLMAKSQYPPNW